MTQPTLFPTQPPIAPPITSTAMSQELSVLLSHETAEWYTPPVYVEAARRVMGVIDLDPASNRLPQSWIKAERYYTTEDDGLCRQWRGRVWLNPPYGKTGGQSNQDIWSQKLIGEYHAGRVSEAILLVKAALGYGWFDRLFERYPVCLMRGLIRFIKHDGSQGGKAKLGSAFFYVGPRFERFEAEFGQLGRVIDRAEKGEGKKRRKRRTLFDDLLTLPDFEPADWNKLRFRGTALRLVPAQPEGLKIEGTGIAFGLDEEPGAVVDRCEKYLSRNKKGEIS